MSKKILSIFLAVLMVVSILAVSASAFSLPATGQGGIYVESDAVIGQNSGTVTAKVYWVYPEGTNSVDILANTNIVIGYNSAKYSYVAGSRVYSDKVNQYLKTDASYCAVKATMWNALSGKLSTNDVAYGYDTPVQIQGMVSTTAASSVKYGVTIACDGAAPRILVATLKFSVLDTLTESDAIGVIDGSITGGQTVMKFSNGKTSGTKMIVNNCGAAIPSEVANKAVQIKDNGDGTYALGFVGTFVPATIDPAFDAVTHVSATLESVGVTIAVEGASEPITATTDTVYDDADNSGYKFRAILGNLDAATYGNKKITVTMFVKVKGVDDPIKAGEVVTTLNDQLARVGW